MSGELYHSQLTGSLVHVMHTWTVADESERLAIDVSNLTEKNDYLYKICLQLDNFSYWLMTDVDTNAWSSANNTFANINYTEAVTAPQTLTDGTNIAFNCALGQVAKLTIAGARTLDNPTNLKAGTSMVLYITHSGANRTLAFGSMYKFPTGANKTLSTVSGKIDVLYMMCVDVNRVECNLVLDYV